MGYVDLSWQREDSTALCNHVFVGFPKWGGMKLATYHLPSQSTCSWEASTWQRSPCLLEGPKMGRNEDGYTACTFLVWKKQEEIKLVAQPAQGDKVAFDPYSLGAPIKGG